MTTMPTLEELLGEEKLAEMSESLKDMACDTYQPLLDMVIQKVGTMDMKATLLADVKLILEEENGQPVVYNSISFDILFHPQRTYDMLEKVQRDMVKQMFASAIGKK